jgi:hypothetical protein
MNLMILNHQQKLQSSGWRLFMVLLLRIALISCIISGCTTPLLIDNGAQSKVFIPCENEIFCFRDAYNIAWDNWCPNSFRDFPVSYRSKHSDYESIFTEYILVPKPEKPGPINCGGTR